MNALRLSVWLLCLIGVVAQPALQADELRKLNPLELDGAWVVEIADGQSLILTIEGQKIEMTAALKEKRVPMWSGKLRIVENEPYEAMDWVELKSGNTRLPDNKCIFRLRGDTMIVMGGGPDRRPSRFFSGPGSEPRTLVFFRAETPKEAE